MATIVIADDSPTLRRIVTSVLTKEGHEVHAAEDGIGAVQKVFEHQPDAVVLDVQMPRVSGFIAARVLKDDWQTADIPVVMLTSLDAAADRYWAGQAGVDRYLTKDFEAGELAATISEVLMAGQAARGGRPALKADPLELSEEDVLSRVCDLLDRKLFESSVAQAVTAIAATANGLEQSVAALLGVLQRFVGYDLAAVLLAAEKVAYVAVGKDTAQEHYTEFMSAAAEAISVSPPDLSTRVAQAGGELVEDPEDLPNGPEQAEMATYASMPLRGHGGAVVGVLALSSATKNAFGETALSTLKLIEGPAAIVIDNARLSAT
ncbi:MAG: response regulator receiver protein [Frankiales bacterium]|nr:response regulator receiver protein [Frankiales bacterium]